MISLLAGMMALPVVFFVPALAGLMCLFGIGFGISGFNTARKQIAIAGIALCVAVLVIGKIYAFFFCPPGSGGSLGGG